MAKKRTGNPTPSPHGPDVTEQAVVLLIELKHATEKAEETLREMRGLIKDLTAERKTVQGLVNGIHGRVDNEIDRHLKEHFELMTRTMGEVTEQAVSRVNAQFDNLASILTGESKKAQRGNILTPYDPVRRITDAP